jgi:hypothetical protein
VEKKELIQQLKKNHLEFTDFITNLIEDDFLFSLHNEKWTAGQQLQHLVMSVSPLVQGLFLPTFILGFIFGKANRKSKSYDELVAKYYSKLQAGGRAPARFLPKKINFEDRMKAKNKLLKLVDKLCKQLQNLSEKQLDTFILPHPLLGKITLREMFYFTNCHVQHHLNTCRTNLASK